MTSRFAPLAPRVCRASAAIRRATLNERMAEVSLTSCMSTACSRGTTSMWPCVIGWMSMNAMTLSSTWVRLAAASPLTIAQKMQSSPTADAKLKGALLGLRTWFRGRCGLGHRRGFEAVGADLGFDLLCGFSAVAALAVAGRLERPPLAPPAPARPPVSPMRPREPLHLRADADPLAGGDDRAYSGDEAVLLAVLEERTEKLRCATDDRLGVADDDEQLLRARDGDVDPVGVVEEADGRAVVRAHERQDHRVGLSAFECIHRFDVIRRDDALERAHEPVHLRVVHGDHGEVSLADPPADDRRDVRAEGDLELVRDRPLGVAILVLRAGVDPHQLTVERPRQRHARVRSLMDELAVIEEV